MKEKLLLLVIATLMGAFNSYAQKTGTSNKPITNVTEMDALIIVSKQFANRDVDYFILENNSDLYWTIFIDAEPMKGGSTNVIRLLCPNPYRLQLQTYQLLY